MPELTFPENLFIFLKGFLIPGLLVLCVMCALADGPVQRWLDQRAKKNYGWTRY